MHGRRFILLLCLLLRVCALDAPRFKFLDDINDEEREKLRSGVVAALCHVYHEALLARMAEGAPSADKKQAEKEYRAFMDLDKENELCDAWLRTRLDEQEAAGLPLGAEGTPLAWSRVQVRLERMPRHPQRPVTFVPTPTLPRAKLDTKLATAGHGLC